MIHCVSMCRSRMPPWWPLRGRVSWLGKSLNRKWLYRFLTDHCWVASTEALRPQGGMSLDDGPLRGLGRCRVARAPSSGRRVGCSLAPPDRGEVAASCRPHQGKESVSSCFYSGGHFPPIRPEGPSPLAATGTRRAALAAIHSPRPFDFGPHAAGSQK